MSSFRYMNLQYYCTCRPTYDFKEMIINQKFQFHSTEKMNLVVIASFVYRQLLIFRIFEFLRTHTSKLSNVIEIRLSHDWNFAV